MKKVLGIVLALIMVFAMVAACDTQDDTPESTPTPTPDAGQPDPDPDPDPDTDPVPAGDEFTANGLPMPKGEYTVVYTMFNGLNPVARSIETGFIAAAEDAGINLIVYDNELDPVVMNANVDMAIVRGDVDFYVVYTNDVESNPQLADKLQAAEIPFGTIGTPAITSDGYAAPHLFVATDNYNSAFMAAEAVMLAAKDKGWAEEDVVFLSMGFLEAGAVFLVRTEAAKAGAHSVFPNLEALDQYIETSSTGSPEVAAQRTTDVLLTLPADKKLVMWTHSDDVTAPMIAAVQAAGREDDALIVSNGLVVAMLDMIREPGSIIVGSVDLGFQFWGWMFMEHIINFLNDGTELPAEINAPYSLVTPQNVNERYDAEGVSVAHWTDFR